MLTRFMIFAIAAMGPSAAIAQSNSYSKSHFCAANGVSAKFNDTSGFSNVAIRQGGMVKVYREIASSELDWAVYDTYLFSGTSGKRISFARSVIYAGNPIVYVQLQGENGRLLDNRTSLPEGMFVPTEPYLKGLSEFCALTVKQTPK